MIRKGRDTVQSDLTILGGQPTNRKIIREVLPKQ